MLPSGRTIYPQVRYPFGYNHVSSPLVTIRIVDSSGYSELISCIFSSCRTLGMFNKQFDRMFMGSETDVPGYIVLACVRLTVYDRWDHHLHQTRVPGLEFGYLLVLLDPYGCGFTGSSSSLNCQPQRVRWVMIIALLHGYF